MSPLQGRWRRRFELIEFLRSSGHTGGPARAESPTSSEPRATPWVNVRTAPSPCKGKSNKQRVRPYFCPYRAMGFILWYPGRCPGLGTGCPFRALAAHFIIPPARPRNSLIRVIRCYAVRGPNIFRCNNEAQYFSLSRPPKLIVIKPLFGEAFHVLFQRRHIPLRQSFHLFASLHRPSLLLRQ